MTVASVILPDSTPVSLESPYGYETVLERPGHFRSTVILSPINQRIQVLDYEASDLGAFAAELLRVANLNGYGKIWLKARRREEAGLNAVGFESEAYIPRYFKGEDAVIMAMYPRPERRIRPNLAEEEKALAEATAGPPKRTAPALPPGYVSSLFKVSDATDLASLYEQVFPTYPYPISDPAYLIRTAATHIAYRLIRNPQGLVVAAASAETNPAYQTAEMTDFAALPSERGKGLALSLLLNLEVDAQQRFGTQCFYTVARAAAPGMLRTFHHGGYVPSGTLVNNCSIAGGFETMLVFHKP
jgi:putative beta-lysine N-acetyltransferase